MGIMISKCLLQSGCAMCCALWKLTQSHDHQRDWRWEAATRHLNCFPPLLLNKASKLVWTPRDGWVLLPTLGFPCVSHGEDAFLCHCWHSVLTQCFEDYQTSECYLENGDVASCYDQLLVGYLLGSFSKLCLLSVCWVLSCTDSELWVLLIVRCWTDLAPATCNSVAEISITSGGSVVK
jgi:hypothetical protein